MGKMVIIVLAHVCKNAPFDVRALVYMYLMLLHYNVGQGLVYSFGFLYVQTCVCLPYLRVYCVHSDVKQSFVS